MMKRVLKYGLSRGHGGAAEWINHSLYVTVMAAMITMFSVADRNILSVLLVPVQHDLRVNDTAMGALTGVSFTLVYATVALPMARLADRGVRKHLIAGAVAVWSIMTAACGFASSYAALLVARMGVAAGEAAAQPAIMSMVGDLFPAHRRGFALAIITVGAGLGTGLGAFVAGLLADRFSWQAAFIALGTPGLLLALMFQLTVREPTRGLHDGGDQNKLAANWRESLTQIFTARSIGWLLIGNIFVGLAFAIYLSWIPTYLVRVRGMPVSQMSGWLGLIVIPSLLGILAGGAITDRLVKNSIRWRTVSLACMLLLAIPIFLTLVATNSPHLILSMMLLYAFVVSPVAALYPAANLDVVGPRLRATMTAVSGFGFNVIGGGLGPIFLGFLTDVAQKSYGVEALRYTLLCLPLFLFLGAMAFLAASRFIQRDIAAVREMIEYNQLRS
jgi:MFS family permease